MNLFQTIHSIIVFTKKVKKGIDLSGKFEVSLKHKFEMTSNSQMGGVIIIFEKFNATTNSNETIMWIEIQDHWSA